MTLLRVLAYIFISVSPIRAPGLAFTKEQLGKSKEWLNGQVNIILRAFRNLPGYVTVTDHQGSIHFHFPD